MRLCRMTPVHCNHCSSGRQPLYMSSAQDAVAVTATAITVTFVSTKFLLSRLISPKRSNLPPMKSPMKRSRFHQVIGSTAFGFIIAMVTVIVETMDPQVIRCAPSGELSLDSGSLLKHVGPIAHHCIVSTAEICWFNKVRFY